MIWQERMVSRAASCFAGVTPAQQEASQEMGVSGRVALISRALDTTQISVHRPTSSISMPSSSRAAESGLVDDVVRVDQIRDIGADLPALGSADAVRDREIFTLLGIQVEIGVGVARGKDVFLGVGLYFGLDVVDYGDSFGRSESAVDKIVLHIDHK